MKDPLSREIGESFFLIGLVAGIVGAYLALAFALSRALG